MTIEQAEANWTWDDEQGDIRPKEWPKNRRIPCTEKNIMAQQVARPGTLIHTAAKTSCPRKKCGTDRKVIKEVPVRRMSSMELSAGQITQTAIAGVIDNVNCLWCRKDYFATESKRAVNG